MIKRGVARQRGRHVTLLSTVSELVPEHHDQYPQDNSKKSTRRRFSLAQYERILRTRRVGWIGIFSGIVLVALFQIANHTSAEEKPFPRHVRCINNDSGPPSVRRLDLDMEIYPSKRSIYISEREWEAQEHLKDSNEYNHHKIEPLETDECRAQYSWQLTSFPTCNAIHETDLTNLPAPNRKTVQVRLITYGFYRDVWLIQEFNQAKRVLKTLRYEHDFTPRNYDRHRRDALAMERLTKSPHILNIYGYCGNSGLFEYAEGGDISRVIWPSKKNAQNITQIQKLHIATQVAASIADMHNIDKEGQASMAHTDITPAQFVWYDGMYRLNDFNRARFLGWSRERNEPCGYHVGSNPGKVCRALENTDFNSQTSANLYLKNRSPEEYAYELQSEKVDIYSMGNIFYMLLTSLWPFEELEENVVKEEVKNGNRPTIPIAIRNSNDPIDQILKEAMVMSHVQDPHERATARQVETFLKRKLLSLDPDAMKSWGQKRLY